MSVARFVFALAAGCGRIGFDAPSGGIGDGGARDGGAGDGRSADASTIPSGPLVWMKMDSGPTGGIVDSAGGHPAACVSGCPTRVVGLHADAYSFSGQDIIVSGNGSDLDVATGFTGAVWIKVPSLPSSLVCAWTKPFNGANGYDSFALCVGSGGTTVFDGETPAGVAVEFDGPAIANTGVWQHLAVTWDGAMRRCYVNGVEVDASPLQLGHSPEALELGGARGAFFVQGELDDALYYGRALSAAEIQQLATP
jgi:hypothetical protein